jgi:tRNA-dihydrouridine synthase
LPFWKRRYRFSRKALEYKINGLDGMMIGRAAIGYPWIFNEINIAFAAGDIWQNQQLPIELRAARNHLAWSMVGRVNALGL